MTKNNSTTARIVTAQSIAVEEITDPNEIRAIKELDRRRSQMKRVLGLAGSLSEQERVSLVTRLVPFLADEDQIEFIYELLKLAPPDEVEKLETELQQKNDQSSP